ncbi:MULTISPECIES: hypothetical protein [unclassified Clostridium]|uniref:hypothetical protein n=1 Tax=unclassified Clostridium TaxID=2614128 RepID=UPI00207A79D8|nr:MULTISPECIES: hypothetical protein [unclassified Clostridium]
MLNELYNAIGENRIKECLENQESNGLYIRIPLDREINIENDVLLIENKDDINIKNQKTFDWFKTRKRYCSYINSNKALVIGKRYDYPRIITTNQINGVKFNSDTIKKKIDKSNKNLENALYEMVKEFCDACNNLDMFFTYQKGLDILLKNYNELLSRNKNIVINMYLDIDIQDYIDNYKNYMKNKLIDGKMVNDKGVFSLFATSNTDKPHLFMRSNIYNNNCAFKTTFKNAEKLRNLQLYLMSNPIGNINFKNGTIKYKSNKGLITEYEYLPIKTYDLFERKPLYIEDYKIDSSNKFKYQVEVLIGKKETNEIKNFKLLYEGYYRDVNNLTVNKFKYVYNKFIKSLYHIGQRDFEDKYRMNNIIRLNMCTSDYFFNTKIEEELKIMEDNIKIKILKLKHDKKYIIESDKEYWYLIGSVASYITSLSKSGNSTLRLKLNYCNINNTEKILERLDKDLKRYGYDLEPNSRCIKLYSAILNYSNKTIKLNNLKLKQGLFEQDNIIYTKNKEN